MLTYYHGLGILSQKVVSLEYEQAQIAHLKRTLHYASSRQTTIIPAAFKHFKLTLCTLITTQYEKKPVRTIEYTCWSIHIHTPNYTQGNSAERSSIFGGESNDHCDKEVYMTICTICINADSIMVTRSYDLGKNTKRKKEFIPKAKLITT